MITLTFELPRFNRQMQEIGVLCGLSNAQVVSRTSQHWLADCHAATPPTGRGAGMTKVSVQKKLGTRRIITDITKRGFPLLKNLTKNAQKGSLMAAVQRLATKGDYSGATRLLGKTGIKSSGVIREPTLGLHRRIRDKGGRVKKGVEPYFVANESAQKSYLTSVLARLGRGKAGWALAASRLRVKLPSWVSRHSVSGYFKGIQNEQKPVIEFGNRAPHVQGYETQIMKNTARFRERQMQKELVHFWRAARTGSLSKLRARFAAGRKDVFVATD